MCAPAARGGRKGAGDGERRGGTRAAARDSIADGTALRNTVGEEVAATLRTRFVFGVLSLYSMSGDASGKPTPSFFFSLRENFLGERKNRFLFLFFSMFVFGDGIAAFFLFLLVVCGLGHRQISPSLSSLCVRTLLSRIAPCLCITSYEATNASGLPDTS